MMMTHLLCHTNDLIPLGQMSVVTGHHDIWYQATHVTVVINATTNWELERPKPHYPPPPAHSVTTCLINIYHRHRVRLRLFISRSQEVNKGDNSLDRTKQKWHNKKEREINELSYHSTKGFPRIERVFPRTWVAAYISSASRLEWQSNIVEAISYEFIYNWKDGGSVTSKTHLNCTSQKYSDELCLLIEGKLKLIPGVRPGDLKCWAHAIMNIFKSSKRDSFMKETWSDWWTFCHESIFPWLLSN